MLLALKMSRVKWINEKSTKNWIYLCLYVKGFSKRHLDNNILTKINIKVTLQFDSMPACCFPELFPAADHNKPSNNDQCTTNVCVKVQYCGHASYGRQIRS